MKVFKHMTALVLALVMAAALAVTAYAATVTVKYREFVYSSQITFRQYDYSQSTSPTVVNMTISATSSLGSGSALYHVKYANGTVAYCIQPGVHSDDSGSYVQGSSGCWYNLPASVQSAIALALACGYPSADYGTASGDRNSSAIINAEKWAATQAIIWELICEYRSAYTYDDWGYSPFYDCVDTSRYPTFELWYNKAAAWQNLLKQESATIAEAMRIQTDGLRWYAAYHDEGHHPHVHMMVWSTEPKKGYLTREGIAVMRSRMTNAIFHEEMTELYIKKDAAYKESIQTAKESLLLYIRMLEGSESADPVIEQKLWELSHALEQVDGKHVYAYLPKEVKTQVDEIMERLAQLPEVAACYEQWWKLKDEIASYYGRNTPPHQPLVQQKEFRTIKNFIIREAETFREPTSVQMSTDAEPREPRKTSDETPTAVQQPQIAPLQNALTADAVMQLLHHMSRMFRGNMPVIPPALRIDSKRRRRLQEKRMAMGHKRDDHEDEQLHHVNDNTMQ